MGYECVNCHGDRSNVSTVVCCEQPRNEASCVRIYVAVRWSVEYTKVTQLVNNGSVHVQCASTTV